MWSAAVLLPALPAPQRRGEELAGVVAERQHRVEAESLLERRRGLFLLAVADHDRGVQVDHQPRQLAPGRASRRERLDPTARRAAPTPPPAPRPEPMRPRPTARCRVGPAAASTSSPTPPPRTTRPDRPAPQRRRSSSRRRRPRPPCRPAPDPDHAAPAACADPPAPRPTRAVSVVRSATSASSRDPACDTTPSPSAVAVIFGRVVVACTSKVLLYLDDLSPQQAQFPLVAGHFRLSSRGHADRLMKSQG